MTEHERRRRGLLLGERKKLRRQPAHGGWPLNAAMPAQKPHSTKNKTTGFSMGPQAPLRGRSTFALPPAPLWSVAAKPFVCMRAWASPGVELYLFPTQGGGTRQGGDLGERAAQLSLSASTSAERARDRCPA